ncbi:MAG TPA: hypothetical protein VEX13_17680, partial [Chloroflexia bacterium]|nr:hypothetical protein [Chloroflexia bacterium]
WVQASRGALVQIKYSEKGTVSPIAVKQREAFDAAQIKDYPAAMHAMQEAVNSTENLIVRGWIKQQLAEYTHFVNPVESQLILRAAVNDNRTVTHPLEGITYTKLQTHEMNQARQCVTFLTDTYKDPNALILAVNGLLDELVFQPETSTVFERAMAALARHLGFDSQRPENDFRQGPDVLWEIGQLEYLIIECKNGSTTTTINKSDCDQLSGSMNWFRAKYDATCSAIPIMVHPARVVERNAAPPPTMRVVNDMKLDELRLAVRNFAKAVVGSRDAGNPITIGTLLRNYDLTAKRFVDRYTVGFHNKR